jgi:hypothetical protein
MSIPYIDPRALWAMPPDEFNAWRAVNDLPKLLTFFRATLPGFEDWLRATPFGLEQLLHFVPTGELFRGEGKNLFVAEVSQDAGFRFYKRCASKESLLWSSRLQGKLAPDFVEIEPYFAWAKRVLGRDRYFYGSESDRVKTDSFEFNHWTTDENGIGRALLFRSFAVLKMGGVVLGSGVDIGSRNLDFVDLDSAVIEGTWRPSSSTQISFSSARSLTIRNTLLHHFTLRECPLESLKVYDAELQNLKLEDCTGFRGSITRCKVINLEIRGSRFFPDFDESDLSNVKFQPGQLRFAGAGFADNYRRLRAAYQSKGKRREAAEAYYLERVFERKELFNPYLSHRDQFPPMTFAGTAGDIFRQWYKKECSTGDAFRRWKNVVWFHVQIWTKPKYLSRAIRYRLKYLTSLMEAVLWGYGERPARIFAFAVAAITAFSLAYFFRPEHLLNFPHSARAINALYFSIVTFTTLGYGDILPADSGMKLTCAAEALLGAFTMGMVVAGFANRGRY